MIWGIGCHRSGTKSLAKQIDGVHEPKPWLKGREDPDAYWKLVGRYEEGVPCIDAHQSWFMDEIRDIDPDPEFIWLVRNPIECVHSLVQGDPEYYGNNHSKNIGYFPKQIQDLYASKTAYWIDINTYIYSKWITGTVVETWSLKEHENKFPTDKEIMVRYARDIMDETHELYGKIQ